MSPVGSCGASGPQKGRRGIQADLHFRKPWLTGAEAWPTTTMTALLGYHYIDCIAMSTTVIMPPWCLYHNGIMGAKWLIHVAAHSLMATMAASRVPSDSMGGHWALSLNGLHGIPESLPCVALIGPPSLIF